MKRSLSLFLCFAMLLSLWGCEAAPVVNIDPTLPVISDQEKVVYPQTGDYQETALLANVSGQGWPQLLSVRKDGTVDYVFSASEKLDSRGRLTKDGIQYYTITPSGSYSHQEAPWIGELEQYLTRAWSDTGVEAACWQYVFAAEDGVILILAQLEDPMAAVGERILCSALFKVENGAMTMIPMNWNVETDSGIVSLGRQFIGGLRLEDDTIVLELIWSIAAVDSYLTAEYEMNGELLQLREAALYPSTARRLHPVQHGPGGVYGFRTANSGRRIAIPTGQSLGLAQGNCQGCGRCFLYLDPGSGSERPDAVYTESDGQDRAGGGDGLVSGGDRGHPGGSLPVEPYPRNSHLPI